MTPKFEPGAVARTRPWEYGVRFLFGGVVTAAAGVVAERFGPEIGGLFLAFPAILPASLTLVDRHDGREDAVDAARGACLGSLGLAAFALTTWRAADAWPPAVVLGAATLVWVAASVAAWAVCYGLRRDDVRSPARCRTGRGG